MRSQPFMVRRLAVLCLASAVCLGLLAPGVSAGADASRVQQQLDAAAAEYGRLETELAETDAKRSRLEAELAEADLLIAEKSESMRARAGALYKTGGVSTYMTELLMAPDPTVFFRRLYFVELLGREDSQLIDSLRILQARADEMRSELSDARAAQARLVEDQRNKRRELEARLRGAQTAARVSQVRTFSSFTLPVAGPQAFANTWGAPRSGGRRHRGTDVMAPCGAPVVAVTEGVISNLSSGGNGGIMLYLRANNGDVFFYAHLRGYAQGITRGTRVSTGQRVGINGNTGNARGGPCHVHFEWHKGGGSAVNPYPLLNAAR